MEILFTGLIVISSVTILLTWVVVRATEREEEQLQELLRKYKAANQMQQNELYDKSKVKYTDGDNT